MNCVVLYLYLLMYAYIYGYVSQMLKNKRHEKRLIF